MGKSVTFLYLFLLAFFFVWTHVFFFMIFLKLFLLKKFIFILFFYKVSMVYNRLP